MLHRHSPQVIFEISCYIMRFFCIILALFLKILWENISFIKELLFYNFVDFHPRCCIMFVDILNFVNISNVNVQFLFICFYLLFLLNINFHIIARFVYFAGLSFRCDIFISIFLYIRRPNFRVCSIYLLSIQTSFQFINNPFTFKNSL